MRQETSGVVRWSNRPMRQETSSVVRRSNRPVRKQEPSRIVRRGNRSMCHFERIVTAPIAKQCNTQKQRTTNKFFHYTLLFLRKQSPLVPRLSIVLRDTP